jgi:NADH-ubiquinone oxidoreductase chain 3
MILVNIIIILIRISILLIVLILIVVNLILSELFFEIKNNNYPFECGIECNFFTRVPFSIQFFLVGVIFIIFDIEIIVILRFLFLQSHNTIIFSIVFFVIFIILRLIYE